MLDRKVLVPSGYAERACVLVSYRLPLLRHCFVLCHESSPTQAETACDELLCFFLSEAERLARESVGDSQAFMFIHSGRSIRRRANWQLHVFVVQHRWQKAWVYTILGAKNIALVCFNWLGRLHARGQPPAPSIEQRSSSLMSNVGTEQ
jgi:hypothetical protein